MRDVVIIGGGPGGYVAAIRAAQLGLNPLVIEKEALGGVCLNWGCIPTKALLTCAETYHMSKTAEKFGVKAETVSFDLAAMVAYSRTISEQLSGGVGYLMKKNNVEVMQGTGRLESHKDGVFHIHVQQEGKKERVSAKSVVVATGARALVPKSVEVDGYYVWTSKEAMVQKKCPKSLVVVGSGAIGLEFASFYRHLGTEVHIVEGMDRLLPAADDFISSELLSIFRKRGIHCLLQERFASVDVKNGACHVHLESGKTLEASALLLALGVRANTENIGLEELGVTTDRGRIQVDTHLQTNVPGLYAIGDVTSDPWLAHKASHEGILCVEHIAGQAVHPINKNNIPACVYSTPQIASIGLTEAEAKKKGHALKVGVFPFQANGKALAIGAGEGAVKTIFDEKTGELLGAHMIGAGVTELISNFAVAKTLEATEAELAHTIFPHPTLSESLHESVLSALGRGVHF